MVTDATDTSTETTENENEEEQQNVLDMSDDDFLKMSLEDETETSEDSENNSDSEDEESDETVENEESEDDENSDAEDETDNEEEVSDTEEENEDETTDDDDEETDSDSDENSEDTDSDTDDKNADVDYEAAYKKLTAPFKANGTQIQVANVDDAITLMQMGANYHKKMAGLKPSLKVVKMLEKHNLLDPAKINYLIDLDAKKPEAIKQLVKDSGINPMEIDVTEENTYTPEDRSVSDTELDVDNVLDSIKDTPTYSKTIQVITEQWDDKSRGIIAEAPHIISLINEHMADGTYDKINAVVTRERSLGRLNGYSDLEAYKTVGDLLYQQHQLPGQTPSEATHKAPVKKATGITEKRRKAKKKAVSPTKVTKSNSAGKLKVNPLAMSDEEFAKISEAQLY